MLKTLTAIVLGALAFLTIDSTPVQARGCGRPDMLPQWGYRTMQPHCYGRPVYQRRHPAPRYAPRPQQRPRYVAPASPCGVVNPCPRPVVANPCNVNVNPCGGQTPPAQRYGAVEHHTAPPKQVTSTPCFANGRPGVRAQDENGQWGCKHN